MTSDIVKRQRTVPTLKLQELHWQIAIPERLTNGAIFDRCDEVLHYTLIAHLNTH